MFNFKDDQKQCYTLYSILLGQGFLAVIPHQLKGERSSTRVPLDRPDTLTGGAGQRNATLCFL